MTVGNFEYRIPVAGPLTIAYFVDAGTSWILRRNQLKLRPDTLDGLRAQFPQDTFNFPFEDRLEPVASTSGKMRLSTGVEFQILMPVMNVPFRIFWARNVLRQNTIVTTPQRFPARELFPNDITFAQAIPFFLGFSPAGAQIAVRFHRFPHFLIPGNCGTMKNWQILRFYKELE